MSIELVLVDLMLDKVSDSLSESTQVLLCCFRVRFSLKLSYGFPARKNENLCVMPLIHYIPGLYHTV